MMKKIRNILVVVLLTGLILPGCNSFLDIQPRGEVMDGKMFEDIQGYRDAMYGIYATMSSFDLYGENLTWGFADQLAHLYYNPTSGMGADTDISKEISVYNYTYPEIENKINSIWGNAYKTISYINNVLAQTDPANYRESFEYRWIAGEAHGLRAFLHFDLMRWFTENILNNPDAGGIPYAYTFDLENKKLFTLKECYQNVLEDLTIAQHLLVDDTSSMRDQTYRLNRYNFMNLSAVYAMKARVFQACGKLDSAAFYAKKVIDSKLYALISTPTALKNEKRYPANSELIWGLEKRGLYDKFYNTFLAITSTNFNYLLPRKDYEAIYKDVAFSAENHDYRWDEFFDMRKDPENEDDGHEQSVFIRFLDVNVNDLEAVEEEKKKTMGVFLVRLPEMYYILAEALCENDLEIAWGYLNEVRKSRGLNTPLDGDLQKFKEALQNERIKELWGDGQVFMDYKRNNVTFLDAQLHENITMDNKIGVFPWPDKEKEFGYTNK